MLLCEALLVFHGASAAVAVGAVIASVAVGAVIASVVGVVLAAVFVDTIAVLSATLMNELVTVQKHTSKC